MRPSLVPSLGRESTPHVIVIGNHKGGTGKSTFAMHIIIALLKAGKRVASFDLDSNQLTLSRYVSNRRDRARQQQLRLELPDHTPITDKPLYGDRSNEAATFKQFTSQPKRKTARTFTTSS
jgi:chromosome partitioning protein